MEAKGSPIVELKHEKGTCEFASAVDITTHLNESNIVFKAKICSSVPCLIMSSASKLNYLLWQSQFQNNNFLAFSNSEEM